MSEMIKAFQISTKYILLMSNKIEMIFDSYPSLYQNAYDDIFYALRYVMQ